MRAWIENDDDITPYIEIDIYDNNGELVEAHGFPCKPLPWTMELEDSDILLTSENGGKDQDD